jgi:hypothetical protein
MAEMDVRGWLLALAACATSAPLLAEVSLARQPDFDVEHGQSTPRDCRPSAMLKRFGDAVVQDCGSFATPADGSVTKPILDARACATHALAARRPFVARWHLLGGDPICHDISISNGVDAADACGSQFGDQTWVLVGVDEPGGYATYWLEYRWETWTPAPMDMKAGSVRASSKLDRCASIIATPSSNECDGTQLQHCFECREATEVAACDSTRDL